MPSENGNCPSKHKYEALKWPQFLSERLYLEHAHYLLHLPPRDFPLLSPVVQTDELSMETRY